MSTFRVGKWAGGARLPLVSAPVDHIQWGAGERRRAVFIFFGPRAPSLEEAEWPLVPLSCAVFV